MNEPKAFASLSSGLLARKGAAKPAMRRQGFEADYSGNLDDCGWNDMGHDPKPYEVATGPGGDVVEAEFTHNPFAGLTPVSPVQEQHDEIESRLGGLNEDVDIGADIEDETAEMWDPEAEDAGINRFNAHAGSMAEGAGELIGAEFGLTPTEPEPEVEDQPVVSEKAADPFATLRANLAAMSPDAYGADEEDEDAAHEEADYASFKMPSLVPQEEPAAQEPVEAAPADEEPLELAAELADDHSEADEIAAQQDALADAGKPAIESPFLVTEFAGLTPAKVDAAEQDDLSPKEDAAPVEENAVAAEPESARVVPMPTRKIDFTTRKVAPRRSLRAAPGSKAKAAFTLRLDKDRHTRLRLASALTGRSAQKMLIDALDEMLAAMPELDKFTDREGDNDQQVG